VLLSDPAAFPRDKLCGGGLTKKSLDVLCELEPRFLSSGIPEFVHEFVLIHPTNHETSTVRIEANDVALVHRIEFDAWLRGRAQDAGATLSNSSGSAEWTIVADGVSSPEGKPIRGPFKNHEIAIATESFVPGNGESRISLMLHPTHDPSDLGYSWVFSRADSVGLGTGVIRSHDSKLVEYRGVMERAAWGIYKIRPATYRNWTIPLFGKRPATNGSTALVGDALGTADPVFLEGIASGLISGKVLVDHFSATGQFAGYEAALWSHPFFLGMEYLSKLQKAASLDFENTFDMFADTDSLRRVVACILGNTPPQELLMWLALRYPLSAISLYLRKKILFRNPRAGGG